MELSICHKKIIRDIPSLLGRNLDEIPEFAKSFFKAMQDILILAKAPDCPHHVAAFSFLYASIVDVFLKDPSKDLSKTMAALDKRLEMFERFTEYTQLSKP